MCVQLTAVGISMHLIPLVYSPCANMTVCQHEQVQRRACANMTVCKHEHVPTGLCKHNHVQTGAGHPSGTSVQLKTGVVKASHEDILCH